MRAKILELEKKFGTDGSVAGLSVCGPSGVGGTNAIVGGCKPAGIATFGNGGLENTKGRALIGGSSRAEDVSEVWGIEVTEGGYQQNLVSHLPLRWTGKTYRGKAKSARGSEHWKTRTDALLLL